MDIQPHHFFKCRPVFAGDLPKASQTGNGVDPLAVRWHVVGNELKFAMILAPAIKGSAFTEWTDPSVHPADESKREGISLCELCGLIAPFRMNSFHRDFDRSVP